MNVFTSFIIINNYITIYKKSGKCMLLSKVQKFKSINIALIIIHIDYNIGSYLEKNNKYLIVTDSF